MHTVNYTTKTEGQMEIHNVSWSVPILKNNTIKEFRTGESKKLSEIFQLKMQLKDNPSNIMEIHYLSPNPVYLKLTLRKKSEWENTIIASKGYHKIDTSKWEYLISIPNYITDYTYYLNFEFIVFKIIKVPGTEIGNDLQNLLNKRLFADVTMKSGEGTEYQVHKAVLACRSAVLKAQIEHNSTANVLESPFESKVLLEVLTFIYSDQVPNINEIPENLLAAADYYQLNKLKSLCEEALHKLLTVENAVDILEIAYLYSANTLMEHALEFIKDGHAKAITETEEWTNLSSLELIKILYEHIMDDVVCIDIDYKVI